MQGAAAVPSRPGGTQFVVLDNVNELQVVLAYAETDASCIAPGQKVSLTFDAVPDLELEWLRALRSPDGAPRSPV